MLDQTPGEMIIALRQGKIDLALTLHGVDLLSRDFYARKLATVRSVAALPVICFLFDFVLRHFLRM